MPFPFVLPTTSAANLSNICGIIGLDGIAQESSTRRVLVRKALKQHRRLPADAQINNLSAVRDVIEAYLPCIGTIYLQSISSTTDTSIPLNAEWRCTLTYSSLLTSPRASISTIRDELAFTLHTLAYLLCLQARYQLISLSQSSKRSQEWKETMTRAMRLLLDAQSIFSYVSKLSIAKTELENITPLDITPNISSALASICLAEATILAVQSDDPYAIALTELQDENSREWMIAAPSIPKVRAHLFARLCIAGAEHASLAEGLLTSMTSTSNNRRIGGLLSRNDDDGSRDMLPKGKVIEHLLKYANHLQRTARAKAARFLGVDAEIGDRRGEGISWLRGARNELGVEGGSSVERKTKKFINVMKGDRANKEVGQNDPGIDAGRTEEGLIVNWLEEKWNKINQTVSYSKMYVSPTIEIRTARSMFKPSPHSMIY